MTCDDHLAIAKGLLLKSIAVIVGSNLADAKKVQAIRSALQDLDQKLLAKDHEALVGKSAWLIHLAEKG